MPPIIDIAQPPLAPIFRFPPTFMTSIHHAMYAWASGGRSRGYMPLLDLGHIFFFFVTYILVLIANGHMHGTVKI